MIAHIKGKLVEKTPTFVVIDVNGVGYHIKISLQTFSSIKEDICKLFTHLSIKEDSHTLFGFYEKSERELFVKLISVSGVGPSTAQIILSTYNSQEVIHYITSADVNAIKSVKGIGSKTAQRIILELKDKIHSQEIDDSKIHLITKDADEAITALEVLGYSRKHTIKIINKIKAENPSISVESLIKKALNKL